MNIRPLIVRELRAEARRANTYWMRALAAGFVIALMMFAVTNAGAASSGALLFQAITQALWIAVLIIVSTMTGDSISRERREGTLGLLFLTPLNAREIVLGKTLLHATRAIVILLSVLPVIGLPFLLGGITAQMLIESLVITCSALILAIGSGMVATVHNTEWMQSLVSSVLLCALASVCVTAVSEIFPFALPAIPISAFLLYRAIQHAGNRLENHWQEEEAAKAQPFWVRLFDESEFFHAAFRWDTRKARDRNPIAWLQEYNWTSRLTKWGWCALLVVAQLLILMDELGSIRFRRHVEFQMNLYRLTSLGIAFTAAASFRRERQTGALELLLVTPVSAAQLIWGRLQGVWFHFFPPFAILFTFWLISPDVFGMPTRYVWYLIGAYICTPMIGFYCSMLSSNVLIAWLIAITFCQLIPFAVVEQFRFEIGRDQLPFAFFLIQAVFAIIGGGLLYENLTHRRFALQQ